MGMTLTQKILAAHAGLAEVKAGQLINAKLDIVLGNDITTPVAINEFERAGFDSVFDKEHIAIVLDHFVPNKDIKSATQSKQCREFANKYDILNFYDVGQMGIEHALLQGLGVLRDLGVALGNQPLVHGQRGHEAQDQDGDGHRPRELLQEIRRFTHAHHLVRGAEVGGHAALGVLHQYGKDDQNACYEYQGNANRV